VTILFELNGGAVAGLRFLLGAISISIFHLAWGLSVTHVSFFVGLDFDEENCYFKRENNPRLFFGLILGLFGCKDLMKSTLIQDFFEKKIEIKRPAWSGKTNEGQGSPLDCHKTANIFFCWRLLINNLSSHIRC